MFFATFRLVLILFLRIVGNIVFIFSKKRKPITIDNINKCFPINNKLDIKRNYKIAKGAYKLLGHAGADFLLLRFYTKKNIDKYVKSINFNFLKDSFDKNRGIILVTGHFGSWELAAHYLALKGYNSLILYNPIKKPKFLENFVKNNREYSGNTLVPKQQSLLSVYKKLKQKGVVTFLADQHCTPQDGLKVPFFGLNVWTHTSYIKLSLKTGAIIVPGYIFIEDLFNYKIEFFESIDPLNYLNLQDPEYTIACKINSVLESVVKQKPDNWMWQHRRFKNL